METEELIHRINALKKEKNAVMLVHNYQRPEIYQVADFIGDSYGLSKRAAETNADIIVFCGVDFMAESAYILNPDKKVLIPSNTARCPMAAMVGPEEIEEVRKPGMAVVSYINTSAEVKAVSDICCTSSNAVEVVNSLDERKILFVPDRNLADYVARFSDKKIIPWDGHCYVHNKFSPELLKKAKELHKDACIIVHPECRPGVIDLADYVCSTNKMIDYAKQSSADEFIIGTEVGMIERLKQAIPRKIFYQVPPGGTCMQMKSTTLELVLEALQKEQHRVVVPEDICKKARIALDRMLEV